MFCSFAAAPGLPAADVLDDPGLAGRAVVSPATERWQQLKSRYQTPTESTVPQRPAAAIPGSQLPIPESAGWTQFGTGTAEPFPELTDAPPWIVPAPNAPILEDAPPKAVVRHVPAVSAEPEATPFAETATRAFDPFAPQAPVEISPALEAQILTAAGRRQEPNEVPPMPIGSGGVRRLRPIGDISPFYDTMVDEDIREYADQRAADYNVKFADEDFQPRAFPDVAMPWVPTNFYHFPLYFEDPALERYGHTRPFLIQPFFSGARFMGQLVALPYQMTIDPICKPVYALGWYRPGECAPKLKYQIPFNAEAAAVQAGVVTGMFFLIP